MRLVPFVPQYFCPDAVRSVRHPDFRNPKSLHSGRTEFRLGMKHRHFFFQRQTFHDVFDPVFDVCSVVKIHGCLARQGQCEKRTRCRKQEFEIHFILKSVRLIPRSRRVKIRKKSAIKKFVRRELRQPSIYENGTELRRLSGLIRNSVPSCFRICDRIRSHPEPSSHRLP